MVENLYSERRTISNSGKTFSDETRVIKYKEGARLLYSMWCACYNRGIVQGSRGDNNPAIL